MKTLTLEGGRLRMKIVPAHSPCSEILYINSVGQAVRCSGSGYAKHPEGASKCRTHFAELKKATEKQLAR